MKKIIKNSLLIVSILLILVVVACGDKDSKTVIEDAASVDLTYKIYYIKEDETGIEGKSWSFESNTIEHVVDECIENMMKDPEEKDLKSVILSPVEIRDFAYDENRKQVTIYFNDAYMALEKRQEVLVRAAIVKTLTQFDQHIDYVQFYVNNVPLKDKDGRVMTMMNSDFVESTSADITNLNSQILKLYFASSDRLMLVEETVYVHYLKSAPVWQVVMESLLTGPLSSNLNATIPDDIKINSVIVENGICYVDLSQLFLVESETVKFDLQVYSIVNSLCKLDGIDEVQILINGNPSDYEAEGICLSEPIKPNYDIVIKSIETLPFTQTGE